MKIRKVMETDYAYIFDCIQKLWAYNQYDKKEVKKVFDEVLADNNSFVFLLEDEGYKGFIHGCFLNTFWMTGRTCYISSLYVDETQRKKGYGKALLEYAKEYAIANKSKAIILDSGFPRTDAHAFYVNNNFEKSCYGFEMIL